MRRIIPVIGIIFLLVVSAIIPMVLGQNIRIADKKQIVKDYNFDRYPSPEYYDCYNADEIPDFIEQPNNDMSTDFERSEVEVNYTIITDCR